MGFFTEFLFDMAQAYQSHLDQSSNFNQQKSNFNRKKSNDQSRNSFDRDYDAYYEDLHSDALSGDIDAQEEMREEFGDDWEWEY